MDRVSAGAEVKGADFAGRTVGAIVLLSILVPLALLAFCGAGVPYSMTQEQP